MVMVAIRAKGALWNANASLFVSFVVVVVSRGPTTLDLRLDLGETLTKGPLKVHATSSPRSATVHCVGNQVCDVQ